ncbi:hypothetical protein CFC21_069071 [Triticum aestivum]|uniref:F-box domain-containing protein n=3 Tax=Triticum TaxID=4564 RepID=A0A9R1AE32_TRITD|nr:F-box protein At4g00755-like [Triticum aestivum]KAF7062476.1 hypothetical protein CFC21_069071 [Triticum aestivum]VAI25346.1 unnamed protein product [Triticum turgidum subsp. durum]
MAMSKPQQGDPAGFLDLVGPDLSACVFARLQDPADLARAATVSRPWRRFVEGNGFLKKVCVRKFPELAVLTAAVEVRRSPDPAPAPGPIGGGGGAEANEHRIYSHLYGALVAASPPVDCILHCVGASSTDNFPDETIDNTLEPQDRVNNRFSYWSSAGQDDPDVPETLTYRLVSDICVVDEIRIQPFKAFFQIGHPIYSSKMVRFRMGHCKLPRPSESFITDDDDNQAVIADENYIWTYTSPEFFMLQENKLQTFKLPHPALCIGGVVKIELLGRVQKQATDDRYYICVCHAQVVGRSLSPVFMVDINDSAGYSILKHLPEAKNLSVEEVMQDSASDSQEWKDALASYRETGHLATALMNVLHEGAAHPAQDAQGDAPHFPHGAALLQEIQAMQGDANLMQQLQVDAQLLYLLQDGVLQLQDDVLQDEDGLQAMDEDDDADGGGVSDNDPFA